MKTNTSSPAQASKDWASLPEWITVDEAAAVSGYHPEYVRRLAKAGKIGAEKKGRDWWIDRDKLRAYLATVEALGSKKYSPHGIGKTTEHD